MKEKILPFIKKYPISILLAIIAVNLFFIAVSLNESAKRNRIELLCSVLVSIEKLPLDKWPNVASERRLKVWDKIQKLVGYKSTYGVDAFDVCERLKSY